ncbi:MAG: autotransporter domain-containing protein [Pseudomonadota bacterium]|nr:autotransporter domain-containing protein [Pseudomonadota bacterium]
MAALTVRREIDTIGSKRPAALIIWLVGLALSISALPGQAQIACPMDVLSGSNQTALAGTRFPMSLVTGEKGATTPIPDPVPVTWNVMAVAPPLGTLHFLQSGTTTFSENVFWSATPFTFNSSVDVVAEPDAGGVYTLRATTPTCGLADATFNLNVVAPVAPTVSAFQGSSQSAVTGTTFPSQLGVFISQGSGLPTLVANAKVTFTITSGPARFSNNATGITVFSDATGNAYVDLIANAGVATATNVTAQASAMGSLGMYTGMQVTPAGAATVTPNPPTGVNYTTPQNQPFAENFSVVLLDSGSAPISGVNVVFQLSGSTGAQLLSGSTPSGTMITVPTDGTGRSTIQVMSGAPGTFSLTASPPTPLTTATWGLVATPAGSQLLLIVSGNGQVAEPESQFAQPLVVEALSGSTPASGVPVDFTVLSGSAYFLGALNIPVTTRTVLTGNGPISASLGVFAGSAVGESVVQAAAPGYSPVLFTLSIEQPEIETVTKVSGDAQQGLVNTVLPQPLVAGITPTARANAPNGVILFEVISGGATFVETGTGTFSAPPSGPGLSAEVHLRLGAQPGSAQIQVSFPGMLPAVFTATGVPPTSTLSLTKVSGDAQTATTGLTASPLRVRLSNGGGSVANGVIDWSVISGDATLSLRQTNTNAQGEAETTLAVGSTTGSIRVRATATVEGDPSRPSVDFTLSAADATLVAVSGSGQGGAIGSNADQVFVFELKQANGSVLPGQTIQFATTDGTLTASSAVTGSDGRVSVGLRYGAAAGSVQVTARAFGSRISAIGVATTFVPLIAIASGNNQTAAAGASLANPLVIAISRPPTASQAKGLQGLVVTWTVLSGGGQLGTATSLTDTNGQASNTLRLGATLGAQQIKATIADVGEVVFTANATIPSNSVLEIVSGNNQRLVPRRPGAPLIVRLRSAAGVGLSGFTVRFTPSDGLSVDPGEVVTGPDGRAATIASVTLPGDYTVTASLPALSGIAPVVFNLGNGIANLPELGGRRNGVARAIDIACPRLARSTGLSPAQQDLLQRCSELVVNANQNTADVVGALDQMLADESSAQNNAALASASAQFENLKGRFAALRSGSSGGSLGGLAIMTPTGRLPFSFLPSSVLLGAADDAPAPTSETFGRWGFFATGTIGRGSRDTSDTDPGGDFDNYGVTAGVDYRLTNSVILGAALGFNSNDSQLKRNLGGLDSKGTSLSAYATWFKGDSYYADGVLTLGRNRTDVTRRINYTIPGVAGGSTTIDQIASGSPDSDQQSFALSVGRDFNRGALSFGPYVRGTYTRLNFDGYVERMSNPTGAGSGLALAVEDRQLTSVQAVLGGKLSYTVSTSWGVLVPSLQIEYVKELKDDADGLVTSFAFDPTNTSIIIDGGEIDTDFLNIGLGLSGVFANGRSGYVYYEHVAGKDRTSQSSLAIGVRIEF